ncbi:protein indeterminate-domain 9-like isoform X1 [Ananas comosus]|uniref:Protein EARLY HEADING DATE 2 n=1 Tax=Ananas comosus TaxID=4615 RepID=A0A6P5ESG1_ANACO|nr:protein indeterminate-domain 9-like isoform X1 [Ananas comosus]XP_020084111.1 protein indeterminate-domain 9-like isoform X1 [Ananas comosus]
MDSSTASAPFFGIRDEEPHNQQSLTPSSSTAAAAVAAASLPESAAPVKKRRNLPGNPSIYPDAEVIALSPKTLMATNRFVCEVCNKGFQREQNLQLHRRGHNLPWKLRQKSDKDKARRRVYLCPEPTCVHHDPSRALGDLTGIKKHFSRKHGEKKWKCDKCSKRYAVHSDLKAHSKTCGTREYRCDCGTLFSRRDSFITHRAFCDALAQESARLPYGLNTAVGSHLYGNSTMALSLSQVNSQITPSLLGGGGGGGSGSGGAASQFDHLLPPANASGFRPPHHSLLQTKPFHGLMQLPDIQSDATANAANAGPTAANLFNLSFFSNGSSGNAMNNNNNNNNNNNGGGGNHSGHLMIHEQFNNGNGNGTEQAASLFAGNMMSHLFNESNHSDAASILPQMSATALLQKAAQMGATTTSNAPATLFRGLRSPMDHHHHHHHHQNESTHLQDLMNSLVNGGGGGNSGLFTTNHHEQQEHVAFAGFNHPGMCNLDEVKYHSSSNNNNNNNNNSNSNMSSTVNNIVSSDRLTRDFLGVGGMMRGMGGAEMSSLDPDMKSASSFSGSFSGRSLQ